MKPISFVAAALAAVLIPAAVCASLTPEERCLGGRRRAAGRYADCQERAIAKFDEGNGDVFKLEVAESRCHLHYAAAWVKLQQKAAGTMSSCDGTRFADNGATVTDRLTGLEWEKKTDDDSTHDKDNAYSVSVSGTAADGTAYSAFFQTLNTPACFAGQCDWRLPTRAELQTILLAPYICASDPCIDQPLDRRARQQPS